MNTFVRRGDPETSLAAAEAAVEGGVVARHERLIVGALLVGPASKCEIARRCGLDQQQVARRLARMRRVGMVARTGRTCLSDGGRDESEYRASGCRVVPEHKACAVPAGTEEQ